MPPNAETGKDGTPAQPAQGLPPDREREAGFRGDAWVRASWMLALVFFAGLAVVVGVLVTRRRRQGPSGNKCGIRPAAEAPGGVGRP